MTRAQSAAAGGSGVDRAALVADTPERLGFVADAADPAAFERYRSFYALGSDVAPLDAGRFHAELSGLRLDRMVVHDRRLRAVSHGRDAARVRRAGLEHFTVTLCLEGTMYGAGRQGFRRIRPGEVWLTDMTQPVATRIEDARLMTLALGRDVVEAATHHPADLHARVLPAAQAAALTRALVGLRGRVATLSTDEAAVAEAAVARLVAQMLGSPSPADATRLERLARARRLIDALLDREDLDADLIAGELAVSRSTVYRLFEPGGGVARTIQARRLERLHRLLAERSIGTSVADLAALVGFASESHASRLFLDRYGVRPGAFRAGTRALSDFAVGKARMSGWLAGLQ